MEEEKGNKYDGMWHSFVWKVFLFLGRAIPSLGKRISTSQTKQQKIEKLLFEAKVFRQTKHSKFS